MSAARDLLAQLLAAGVIYRDGLDDELLRADSPPEWTTALSDEQRDLLDDLEQEANS